MNKYTLSFYLLFLTSCFTFGQTWQAVGTGVNTSVYVLDSTNGLLYAGGTFDTAGGVLVNNIASWNGNSWSALGSGANGAIWAITGYNGSVITGGRFTNAGGISTNNIASWNGSSWSTLSTGLNGEVKALAIYNGNLIAAGRFTIAGGINVNNIAQWNGSSWDSLGGGVNNTVNALAIFNNSLYVGGSFTRAGHNPSILMAKWNGSQWDSLGGIYIGQGLCNLADSITSLAVYKNELFIGSFYGPFIWNGTTWDTANKFYYNAVSLFSYGGYLLMGSSGINSYNDSVIGTIGNGIWGCNAYCRYCYGTSYYPTPYINAIAAYKGIIYAGGEFGHHSSNATDTNAGINIEQYTGPLSVNELQAESLKITVYPNPSTGVFNLQSSIRNYEPGTVEVYNMLGKKIYTQYSRPTTQYQIDLSNQPSGIYLYRIITNQGTCLASGKLVKE